MIFFSTTFSPGAGVEGIKALRYLFARFYLWCRIPGVKEEMEGCPEDDLLVGYTILTGCLGLILFLVFQVFRIQLERYKKAKHIKERLTEASVKPEFAEIQRELYKNAGRKTVSGQVEQTPAATQIET